MTIRRAGRANPKGMALKPSAAEQRRQVYAQLKAMAHSGMSDAGRENLEKLGATVKPKVSRPRLAEPTEPLEHDEQKAVIQWWHHYAKSKQLDPRLLVATPNSQALLRFAANPNAFLNYLKAEGMRVGMSDLTLYVARGRYHGMLIELKRRTKGVVSDEQREMLNIIEKQGYYCVVAQGSEQAIHYITKYMEGI